MSFCNRLRGLIEDRDLTQKHVATELGIAPSTVGGYVQGSSEPDFETLRRLAKYFNVSADYLLEIQMGKTADYREDDLLRIYRGMTQEQQEIYIEQGKAFVRANDRVVQKA